MNAPFRFSFLVAALLLCGLQQASATTYNWSNNSSITTNWSTTASNWTGSQVPASGLDTVITFTTSQNVNATNDLGPILLNRLTATNTGSKNLTIAGSATNNLIFVKNSGNTLPTFAINSTSTGSTTISIPFTVTDALTITNSGTSSASISGAITNTGGITFNGTGTGSITLGSGIMSGTGGITKNGSYTLTMSGTNTFSGNTVVTAGILSLTNVNALQNSTVDTDNSITGDATNGLKTNQTTMSLGGLIGSKDLSSIFTTTSGGYSGITTLTLNPGAGVTDTYSGGIANGAAGMNLTKGGSGTQVLSGANTYTGLTTVSKGTLTLDMANGGLLASTSSLSVGNGANFTVTGASSPTAPSAQTLAGVTTTGLASQATKNVITLNGGVNISAGTLTSGGLTLIRGNRLGLDAVGTAGSANVTFSTTPTLVGSGSAGTSTVGVIANMIGDTSASGTGSGFVTYDAGTGLRLLAAGETTGTVTAGSNVKITGATASAVATVNSLELAAGGSITGSNAITIGNNILLVSGANSGITAKIGPANNTSDFYIIANSDVTGGDIASSGSANVLYKFGAGTASFTPANWNGTVAVNEGTLALGGGTNKVRGITVNGGTLRFTANNIQIAGNPLSIASGATVDFNGATGASIVLSGAGTVTNSSGTTGTLTVGSGTFTGGIGSNLNLISSGALTLSGTNTYTGTTSITGGTLTAAGGAAIGDTSAVTLANASTAKLSLSGSETIGSLAGGGATGGNVTLGANTLTTGGDNTSTSYSGVISGTGGLTKAGSGTQTLAAANTYSGSTTISAGTLALGASGSFDNSPVINLGTSGSQGTLNLTAKSSFDFGSGQTLSGYGAINIGPDKLITVNGTLAPGNSPGVVTVTGDLALGSASATNMEITGRNGGAPVAGTDFDQVVVSGAVTFSGTLNIDTTGLTGLIAGDSFQLFSAGSYNPGFTSVAMTGAYVPVFSPGSGVWTGTDAGLAFTFTESDGTLRIAAVPEPSVYAMLAGVLALGLGFRRLQRGRAV